MIAIVVVCWEHLEETTAPCLRSVRAFTGASYRLICVDNGSRDGTRAHLDAWAARDPRCSVVPLPENRGWAAGTLAGLDAVPAEARAICLLNSDTLVSPGWLTRMAELLEAYPELAVVRPNELPAIDPAPPKAGPGAKPPGFLELLRASRRTTERFGGQASEADPSGYCLLVRREHEGFLRDYLADFERYRAGELDWRDALARTSGRCAIALDTYVWHARGGSGGYYDYGAEAPG